ncbi:asparagine synthase [Microbacterium lushaniae]|uniref:Asparagine synthase n=1 Tax=Microbacterium lushaniae TaxID=2614639 RepID=A0A5J5JKZ7_9MICO|nr:asparagine synthase [Microbacterium lushaniae]KAA9155892.1 asparagine synthase [Microbacterium lushaniae]KAA9157724.1 asparagine synthase [Microbacterium lushaniae]QEW04196.1 asparagine synthase [Microbacterium lushaniae]
MGRTSEAVEEGVSIASAAARLTVRNHILVETISAGATFDRDKLAGFARDTILALAEEQERAAQRMRDLRRGAWGKFSTSSGTHDYRERDMRNLRRRRKQYDGVAKELRAWADDPERVYQLVDAAREAAWGDVEANLQRRLKVEGMTPDADPDYERMRKARMDALRMVDLARLAAHTQRRRQSADAAES